MQFDFLLCSERSGSNLITQMLDSHSEVCGPFPSHLMLRVGRHAYRYGDLTDDARWSLLLQDVVDYLNAMHSKWKVLPTLEELHTGVSKRSFGALHQFIYEHEAKAWGKQRVFVKDNHAFTSFGFVESHYEQPVWVHVVRDPRDMAMTWKANAMEPGGVQTAAQTWKADQVASLEVGGHTAPHGRFLRVRFEDLLTRPEAELERVCAALGLTYEPGMLDFHTKPLLQTNAGNLSSWTDLKRPLDPSNTGRYRAELTEVEIRYVEALCAEEMAMFGYALDYPETATSSLDALAAELPEEGDDKGAVSASEVAIFARWYEVRDRIASRRLS